MWGKLCKYEFKSIVRTLAPIYLAIIAISILNAFLGIGSLANGYYKDLTSGLSFGRNLIGMIQTVFVIAYFGVLVALSVLTLIVVIQRFYKGLLCDEGYLMFTLPVKPWQLIAAKGTVAFVMSMASVLTALVSVLILVLGAVGPDKFFEGINDPRIWAVIDRELAKVPSWPLFVFKLIILIIVSGLVKLYHMYFSMALGHLSNKHRVTMSVVAFIAISGFAMIILLKVPSVQSFSDIVNTMSDTEVFLAIHRIFLDSIIYSFVQLAIFFFGTERILSKRLNLE
jgi:hypothetical protein